MEYLVCQWKQRVRKIGQYLRVVRKIWWLTFLDHSVDYVETSKTLSGRQILYVQVMNSTDTSNFDTYPADNSDTPADDLTGWDTDF